MLKYLNRLRWYIFEMLFSRFSIKEDWSTLPYRQSLSKKFITKYRKKLPITALKESELITLTDLEIDEIYEIK